MVETSERRKNLTKVLFVTTEDLTGQSGADLSTYEMVRVMASMKNVDLSLIAPRPSRNLGLPETVETYWLKPKPAGNLKWHISHQPTMIRALLFALWNERPEQVLARVGPSMIFVPLVQFLPGVEYRALIRGYVHRNLSFQSLVKAVVWLNATIATRRYVSIRGVEEMLRNIGVRGEIKFIPNATDPDRFRPVEEPTPSEIKQVVESAEYVVGFVGSMKERHLVEILIEAVAKLSEDENTALVLVGDGPRRTDLEELTIERGLENQVVFTGHVTIDRVPSFIASCDVMYGLSHFDKPSNPIKIYEYLSCGKPVITTNTDDLAFVNRKRLGIAIDENTVGSVLNALHELYDAGDDERMAMGQRAREHIQANHTWEAYIRKLTES